MAAPMLRRAFVMKFSCSRPKQCTVPKFLSTRALSSYQMRLQRKCSAVSAVGKNDLHNDSTSANGQCAADATDAMKEFSVPGQFSVPRQPADARVVTVAIVGAPNAGKSTLTNKLMGRRVCPVSQKIHTTRRKTLAVLTEGNTQVVFLDTPGFTSASKAGRHHLEDTMVRDPKSSMLEADLIAVLVDATERRSQKRLKWDLRKVLYTLPEHIPSVLILNKIDLMRHRTKLLDISATLTAGVVGGKPVEVTDTVVKKKPQPTLSPLDAALAKARERKEGSYTVDTQDTLRITHARDREESATIEREISLVKKKPQPALSPLEAALAKARERKAYNETKEGSDTTGAEGKLRAAHEKDEVESAKLESQRSLDRTNFEDISSSSAKEVIDEPTQKEEDNVHPKIGELQRSEELLQTTEMHDRGSKNEGSSVREREVRITEENPDCDKVELGTTCTTDGIVQDSVDQTEDAGSIEAETALGYDVDAWDKIVEARDKTLKRRRSKDPEKTALHQEISKQRGWPGFREVFMVSAKEGEGVDKFKDYLLSKAKPGNWQYSPEFLTDQSEHEVVYHAIREKLLEYLPQEVPYNIHQEVEMWEEGEGGELQIVIQLIVSKPTHVPMVIGPKGATIRKLAKEAGQEIENTFYTDVFLKLGVKYYGPRK